MTILTFFATIIIIIIIVNYYNRCRVKRKILTGWVVRFVRHDCCASRNHVEVERGICSSPLFLRSINEFELNRKKKLFQ